MFDEAQDHCFKMVIQNYWLDYIQSKYYEMYIERKETQIVTFESVCLI